jgi:hypothetical protein
MAMPLTSATITRLEKAAVDNGFDQECPHVGEWIAYSSTQAPLKIWLTAADEDLFVAAFSQQNVVRALSGLGAVVTGALPTGASGARSVADIPALHHLVRRAFQLSTTLPDELLHKFEKVTATLPRATEVERLVVQRVGQDIFRAGLIEYWEGSCAITGLAVARLLRASHIKPWADCESDRERLDVFNGLLLAPHLDAAFDCGLITVADDGAVVVSTALGISDQRILALAEPLRLRALADAHRAYLSWHRQKVFR